MEPYHIKVGKRYADMNGNVREVIAEGPQYVMHPHQVEKDNIRIQVIKVVKLSNSKMKVGEECNTTRKSFATWARTEVKKPTGTTAE